MNNEQNHQISEIEDALNIARATRENLTLKNGTLENCLLGFYTVAQILNKTDDMEWCENEIQGNFDK